MLNNLNAELERSNVSKKQLAKHIGVTPRALGNKIKGSTQFKRDEMFRIRDKFFPTLGIEYLFHIDTSDDSELEFEEI